MTRVITAAERTMRSPLRHRRWLMFEVMRKPPPFCGLHVRNYILRSVKMVGWKYHLRAVFRKPPKHFKSLQARLMERRRPQSLRKFFP